ncbi:hypothetical protein [Mucilaginibacter sp. SG564]|uniref:hypothetical protein n=1 Tax=Mucilaginibacter sp. SG564 TaxID=2587022 RepID=UPI001556B955|nr:hypothetical protein [Mucilaginibacter sp. SG564]NOW98874.1 hypothetical protein [Mucilaginibacter sp. SG564]
MKQFFLMITALILCSASACNKGKLPASTSVMGQWRWVKSVGGIGGFTITPQSSGFTQRYQFNDDSTFRFYRKDTVAAQGKFSIVRNIKSNPQPIDVLKTGGNGFDQSLLIRNDTLYLHDIDIADGYGSIYVRIK